MPADLPFTKTSATSRTSPKSRLTFFPTVVFSTEKARRNVPVPEKYLIPLSSESVHDMSRSKLVSLGAPHPSGKVTFHCPSSVFSETDLFRTPAPTTFPFLRVKNYKNGTMGRKFYLKTSMIFFCFVILHRGLSSCGGIPCFGIFSDNPELRFAFRPIVSFVSQKINLSCIRRAMNVIQRRRAAKYKIFSDAFLHQNFLRRESADYLTLTINV